MRLFHYFAESLLILVNIELKLVPTKSRKLEFTRRCGWKCIKFSHTDYEDWSVDKFNRYRLYIKYFGALRWLDPKSLYRCFSSNKYKMKF